MELKLSMDERPFVKMRYRRRTDRCLCEQLPPSCVRPDQNYSAQVYFKTVEQDMTDQMKVDFFLSQATAAQNNKIATFKFLRLRVNFMEGGDYCVAIDEPLKTLYLIYGRSAQQFLKIFNLSFDQPDNLGYRKITSATERSHTWMGAQGNLSHQALAGIYALRIFPFDGELVSYHRAVNNLGEQDPHVVALPGNVALPKKDNGHAFVRLVENRDAFRLPAHSYDAASLTFPSLGFGFGPTVRLQNAPKASRFLFIQQDCLLVLFNLPPYSYFCSYDIDLNFLGSLKVKPTELFERLVPRRLHKSVLGENRKFKGRFDVIGHYRKFVLIVFDWCVVGVKWPKKWYTMDKLPAAVNQTIVCNLGEAINEEEKEALEMIHFTDGCLYLTFATEVKTPDEVTVTNEYHTINLDVTKFKDYRHCANCDAVEKRKRRNKEGKRTSSFKVHFRQ